jgi:hypothetical protein
MAESRKCLEWAVFIYISTCFRPDLRLLKETLTKFSQKLREKGLMQLGETKQVVADLELTVRCEEVSTTDVATALLQVLLPLIELEISIEIPNFVPIPAIQRVLGC